MGVAGHKLPRLDSGVSSWIHRHALPRKRESPGVGCNPTFLGKVS